MTQTLKFNSVEKDRLFYDKYRYCATFDLAEANALVNLNHEYIDSVLVRRKEWREEYQHRWTTTINKAKQSHQVYTTYGRVMTKWKEITEVTHRNLHNFADFLLRQKDDYKLVTSDNVGRIYTNNTSLLTKINKRPELTNKKYTEAVVVRVKDTIILKNPKHTHRSYLKSIKLQESQKYNLEKFLYTYRDTIRTSPALIEWLKKPFLRSQDYHFIDHDGDSWLMLLALVAPGIIRKTVELVPA
jgi:hypothetical protein